MYLLTRRATFGVLASSVLVGLEAGKLARGDERFVTVGMDFSLTGSDADSSARAKDGALMAIDDVNADGGPGGYQLRVMVLDDGTATAGQYDPAQAAINARKMVADPTVVAAVGPQSSTPGKAMSAIFSLGNLATITPSSTNPDITDPKFAPQYRPKGLPIYFRMVTTDAYQGPNMANFFADTLKVKSVYGLDDSGAFGVGVSAAFEDQARKRGMAVLGHDRLDPKAADYSAVITKIKSLAPQGLYDGGDSQAGVKVAKQSYEALPNVIKAGGDGIFGPSMFSRVQSSGGISAQEARRKASILLVSCRSMTNFAKALLGVAFKRNSGRLWRRALATTSSEGGMPGRMVRSQEPKEFQTA